MNDQWYKASVMLSSDVEAQKIYTLYIRDVEGSIISFRLFKNLISLTDTKQISELIHHASCFICSARRAGRLLETLSVNRSLFSTDAAITIKLEWRKNRSFYEKIRCVRNAIEHINSKNYNETKLSFFNLFDDKLKVTEDFYITINEESLRKIVSPLDAISEAIISSHGKTS